MTEITAEGRRNGTDWRAAGFYLLLSVGLGCLISVILSRQVTVPVLGIGTVVGALVFGFAFGLGLVTEPLLQGLPPAAASAVRAVTYAVGGTAGSFLGIAAGRSLMLGVPFQLPSVAGLGMVPFISAAFALLIALPARAYEAMKGRLAESIARLKEAEYAEKELELARAIQQRLLPPAALEGPGFALAARNLPARHVGGDFFEALPHEDGTLGVAVADVAGKGMGAALIMATAKALLPFLAAERDAAGALRALSERLRGQLSRREFVALAYATLDVRSGLLTVANAGLPDPYLLRAGEPPRPLSVPGPRFPLGVRAGVAYEALTVGLAPGDLLLLVSDGLPEAETASGEPLGYEAFEALLRDLPSEPAGALDALFTRVTAASAAVRADDWTALLVAYRGPVSAGAGEVRPG